jgi:hypothetical protein
MVLYRGPPASWLVLDVSEEDEVSLPMRLPAGALQVAVSSIFLWLAGQEKQFQMAWSLGRCEAVRLTCICVDGDLL